MGVDKNGTWMENKAEVESRLLATPKTENTYTITGIDGNELRTIDRDTATINQLIDFVLTHVKDVQG